MNKLGDIYMANKRGRCIAYWRPSDGSPDVELCTMSAKVYRDHQHVRDLFMELAIEFSMNATA
jgi:hypothetical protein